MKTEGDLNLRARRVASVIWWALVLLTILSLVATLYVRPQVVENFRLRVWGWLIPAAVVASLALMWYFHAKRRDVAAFLASTLYILAMLGGAAFALYPYLLPASTDPANSLTIYNSSTGAYSLRVGLVWWLVGMMLALGYFIFLYRFFWGKVRLEEHEG